MLIALVLIALSMLLRLLLLAGGTAARVVRVAVVCWCSLLLTLIALPRLLLLAVVAATRVVRVAVVCWCSLLFTLIALPSSLLSLVLLDGVAGGVKTPPPNLFYPISFIFIGKLEFQLHVVVTSARLKRQTLCDSYDRSMQQRHTATIGEHFAKCTRYGPVTAESY